jgi:hypothetical protein
MARAFKEITGNITKLNEPRFAADRGLWVMMVKENDRWIAINSRDEVKIRDYHTLLSTRKTAVSLNLSVQATTLSQERVKMAEYAYGILGDSQPKEIVDAAQLLCQQKARGNVPSVSEAAELFLAKQQKRQLAPYTIRDYKRLAKWLKSFFGEQNLSSITSEQVTTFIEQPKNPVSQRSRYIYLKSFLSFCSGKMNPHCHGHPWVKPGLIQWEPPKTDLHEIKVYNYDEIVALLKTAQRKKVLPHFIFRLFGLLRYDEMYRFTGIHAEVRGHPLISLEANRITFNAQVYKKRSRGEHRGRFYNNVHPTFMAWLKKFHNEDASLHCGVWVERSTRRAIKDDRNLLRHTAITYHCLALKNPLQTAYIAGNSVGIIQNHYLNMNVPEADALKLYELTPDKAVELGIL